MSPDSIIALSALGFTLLGALIAVVWKAGHRLSRIEHQLYPNSGQSLRDRVDLVERKLDLLVVQAEDNREQTRRIWHLLDDRYTRHAGTDT